MSERENAAARKAAKGKPDVNMSMDEMRRQAYDAIRELAKGKYDLETPIDFEGEPITSIEYDIESLTGRDLREAAREARSIDPTVDTSTMADPTHTACIFARAAKKPFEMIDMFKALDSAEVTARVHAFFMQQAVKD